MALTCAAAFHLHFPSRTPRMDPGGQDAKYGRLGTPRAEAMATAHVENLAIVLIAVVEHKCTGRRSKNKP